VSNSPSLIEELLAALTGILFLSTGQRLPFVAGVSVVSVGLGCVMALANTPGRGAGVSEGPTSADRGVRTAPHRFRRRSRQRDGSEALV
jgi:hypothetical protein